MSAAAAAAAALSSSAPSAPPAAAAWSSLAQLIVPQRHSSKINRGLVTGHQSVIHVDPHEAAAALSSQAAKSHNEKFHDDALQVDDTAIAFSHTEFMQHAISRLLAHHIEQQQRAACEQLKQTQLVESQEPVDLVRLDAQLMERAERRVDEADARRQADARTKRKESQAAERKSKKQRVNKKETTELTAEVPLPTSGKPKRSTSNSKTAPKLK